MSTGMCAAFACLLSGAGIATPGQLDPTFGNSGKVLSAPQNGISLLSAIAMTPDSKILVAGVSLVGPSSVDSYIRYLSNGAIDPSFAPTGNPPLRIFSSAIAAYPSGAALIGGACYANGVGGKVNFCLVRRKPDGSLDLSWNTTGQVSSALTANNDSIAKVLIQSDGKIVAVGRCTVGSAANLCAARYLSDGSPDGTFNSIGYAVTSIAIAGDQPIAIALQANGALVAVSSCPNGSDTNFCVVSYKSNGTLDSDFNETGIRIIAVGSSNNKARDAAVQSDGKIVIAGTCTYGASIRFCAVRLNADGSTDALFGANGFLDTGIVSGVGTDIRTAIQADSKIMLALECAGSTYGDFCIARYTSNGVLDPTFGGSGMQVVDIAGGRDRVNGFVLQLTGKVLVSGVCETPDYTEFCFTRLKGGPYDPLTCGLNVDANQTDNPAIDALLITRYLLGLRGTALTVGALGQNPTRTGQALEDYLGTLNLDVDGDGQALAMTDGLLLLRAMLGLTGTALTQGATNASHPNVRNAQQILTWIETTYGVACLP